MNICCWLFSWGNFLFLQVFYLVVFVWLMFFEFKNTTTRLNCSSLCRRYTMNCSDWKVMARVFAMLHLQSHSDCRKKNQTRLPLCRIKYLLKVQKNQLHFVTVTEVKMWNSSNEVNGRIISELVGAILTYDVIVVSHFTVWCLWGFFWGGNPKIGILDIALNKLPFHVLLLLGINRFVWSTNTSWMQVQKMYYKNKYSDGQSRDSGSWCETRNVSMFSNSLFLCLFCCIYSLFKSFTFSNMLALKSILLHNEE